MQTRNTWTCLSCNIRNGNDARKCKQCNLKRRTSPNTSSKQKPTKTSAKASKSANTSKLSKSNTVESNSQRNNSKSEMVDDDHRLDNTQTNNNNNNDIKEESENETVKKSKNDVIKSMKIPHKDKIEQVDVTIRVPPGPLYTPRTDLLPILAISSPYLPTVYNDFSDQRDDGHPNVSFKLQDDGGDKDYEMYSTIDIKRLEHFTSINGITKGVICHFLTAIEPIIPQLPQFEHALIAGAVNKKLAQILQSIFIRYYNVTVHCFTHHLYDLADRIKFNLSIDNQKDSLMTLISRYGTEWEKIKKKINYFKLYDFIIHSYGTVVRFADKTKNKIQEKINSILYAACVSEAKLIINQITDTKNTHTIQFINKTISLKEFIIQIVAYRIGFTKGDVFSAHTVLDDILEQVKNLLVAKRKDQLMKAHTIALPVNLLTDLLESHRWVPEDVVQQQKIEKALK